jgi:Putative metallopeptidase
MKLQVGLAVLCAVLCGAPVASSQPAPPERIAIEYVAPTDPAHKALYEVAKHNQVLERVRELLLPVRWPRTLQLVLKGCDGESNAFYENAVVIVCYEFLDDIWNAANSPRRPPAISLEDAVAGPLLDVFLHETGHAMFDLLKIPLLGREEDAADQVAGYYVLQLPKEVKRRLILGQGHSVLVCLRTASAS